MYRDNLSGLAGGEPWLMAARPEEIELILIRPEVVELKHEYADLVASHGLRVVYSREAAIDFAQYWDFLFCTSPLLYKCSIPFGLLI
jgi:hypothetical protein